MILMEMMLKTVMGVMDMEVDKMAAEVANMEVVKLADMVVKIPNEDFTDVTLAIGDTCQGSEKPTCTRRCRRSFESGSSRLHCREKQMVGKTKQKKSNHPRNQHARPVFCCR